MTLKQARTGGRREARLGYAAGMARTKLVLAMMMHETNTFSPVPTPLSSFRPLQGEAAIEEFKDTNTQLGGFPKHALPFAHAQFRAGRRRHWV